MAGQFSTESYIDISDLGLEATPIVMPVSTGWLTTLAARDVTKNGFTATVANWSTSDHSGIARYMIFAKDL